MTFVEANPIATGIFVGALVLWAGLVVWRDTRRRKESRQKIGEAP